MNLALADVGGAMLVVSQFTLLGDCRNGRRPRLQRRRRAGAGRALYERLRRAVAARGVAVATGRFRQHMEVELVNDGPVTFLVNTRG